MEYVCTSCKSDNIQRLSVIYEGGLSDINTKSKATGIGFGRGGIGIGFGASKTKGTAQTASSQRAAPPNKKTYFKPLLLILVASWVLMVFLGNSTFATIIDDIFLVGAAAGWIYYAYQYNSNQWPKLKAIWDHSYLCNRCNVVSHIKTN